MSILMVLLIIISFALTICTTGPLVFSIICCTIIAVSVIMPLAQKTIPRRHSITEVAQHRSCSQLRNIYDTEQDPYDSISSDELDHINERTDKFGYLVNHH